MNIPELGVGLVYWPGLESLVRRCPELVQLIEIEPEAFWHEIPSRPDPYSIEPTALDSLCSFPQPKLIHGVGFPVGSSQPADEVHLDLFRRMVREVNAVWASEHLSFNRAGAPKAFQTGFLLPPLQSEKGACAAVDAIRHVQLNLGVPFAVETGVNYLRPRTGEIPDGEFVRTVTTAADCGILLDLHNMWSNERNGRQSVQEFVSELPLERVWEVHLAGGFEKDGFWLDAHAGAVPEKLLDIAKDIISALPNLGAIIFEILPAFLQQFGLDGVERQLNQIQGLWDARKKRAREIANPKYQTYSVGAEVENVEPEVWENTLGSLVIGREPQTLLGQELARDPGVGILKSAVNELRAGIIVDCLKMSSRLILLSKGTAFMRGLLAKFWGQSPPALFASTEAEAFAAFLSGVDCDVPYLREVLEFDRGSLHARLTGEPVGVEFQCSPTALFDALTAGHLPGPLPLENFHVHITSAETFFTPGKLGEEKPTRFECSMPRPKKEVADELICQGRA